MMTRKDYQKAAEITQYYYSVFPEHAYHIRLAFQELFKDDNPRFDVGRFEKACTAPRDE